MKFCKAKKVMKHWWVISSHNFLRYKLPKIKNCKTQIWTLTRRQTKKFDKVFSKFLRHFNRINFIPPITARFQLSGGQSTLVSLYSKIVLLCNSCVRFVWLPSVWAILKPLYVRYYQLEVTPSRRKLTAVLHFIGWTEYNWKEG